MARRDQRGVTVLELLVAMSLLATALVGLAASFPYALYGVVAGGYQTTATLLAQKDIESAKATDYASLSSLGTGGFVTVSGYDGFQRSVAVATATPTAQTTTVTVVVRFSGVGGIGAGTIYDTTLVTILSQ